MSPWLLEVAGFVIVIIVGIYFGRVHGPWRRSLSLVVGIVCYWVTWVVWFIVVILAASAIFPVLGLSFWDRTVSTKVDFWFVHLAGSIISCAFALFTSRQASGFAGGSRATREAGH